MAKMIQYQKWSKDKLINRVLELEKLTAIRSDSNSSIEPSKEKGIEIEEKGNKKKRNREIDFEKYGQKQMAFKLLYFGWNYDGFAFQNDADNTIEAHLFRALTTSKLIKDKDSCNYSRCGRTDKGVSAFGQVISLSVRSNNLIVDEQSSKRLKDEQGAQKTILKDEIPYMTVLNRLLPANIRIVASTPVNSSFNPRFNCLYRTYKYYFLKRDLNLEKMKEATKYFIGEHNFKNFCKIDRSKAITNYNREIKQFDLQPCQHFKSEEEECEMFEFVIRGTAFLWHQVRFMVSVLFLVGQNLEEPTIVRDLLDLNKYPNRPAFQMASEIPLVLYDCAFEDVVFNYEQDHQERNLQKFMDQLQDEYIRSTMTLSAIQQLRNVFIPCPPNLSNQKFNGDKFIRYRQLRPNLPSIRQQGSYIPISKIFSVGTSGGSKTKQIEEASD